MAKTSIAVERGRDAQEKCTFTITASLSDDRGVKTVSAQCDPSTGEPDAHDLGTALVALGNSLKTA